MVRIPSEAPAWLSLEELYRRTFSYIVTGEGEASALLLGCRALRADIAPGEQFTTAFFLTYRRFSTPLQLMQEFQGRIADIEAAPISKEVQMIALQRYVMIDVDSDSTVLVS